MVTFDSIVAMCKIVHMVRSTAPTPPTDPASAVASVIRELSGTVRLLSCAATGRMVKQGISMTHLHVMWRLEESGELAMSRLAEFLDVSLSNATGLVDRMEERGLVERTRVSNDRRVVLVGLTPAGRDMLTEIQILKQDLMSTILGRLDERRLRRLQAALCDFRGAVRAEEAAHPEQFSVDHDHPHAHTHSHHRDVPRTQQEPASRADEMEYATR